jgi:uncharacterized RDD family membrane protein YckC
VLARFLDGAVTFVSISIVARLAGLDGGARHVVACVLVIVYETFFLATRGCTIGKQLCHITVIDNDGAPLRPHQAFIRTVVLLLPSYLIGPKIDTVAEWIVLLFALANFYVVAKRRDDRRGIHDLAAGTRPVAVVSALA